MKKEDCFVRDTKIAIATLQYTLSWAFEEVKNGYIVNDSLFDEIDENCANVVAQLRNYNHTKRKFKT